MKGIYILTSHENGKQYVGKDSRLGVRPNQHLSLKIPDCEAIHNAIKYHGRDAFDVELIHYPNISHEALNEVERWKIRQLGSHYSQGGYNLTWGGDGVDSETSRRIQNQRIKDGTHPFLNPEIQRKGTESANIANHKRLAKGTHIFQNRQLQGEKARRRVANGTHNFLGGEYNRKRLADGTHPFLNKGVQSRRVYFLRLYFKNKRREFYRWMSVILTAKAVCEERIYRKRNREGYFDKGIPDTSKAKQLDLF